MSEFRNYLIEKIENASKDIYTIYCKPEEGEVPDYLPGQFFIFRNPNVPEEIKHNFRSYSILHPHEPDRICFGIKNKGPFTNSICSLEVGAKVELRGPFGVFGLAEKNDSPIVFLAGGVGITPILCMIDHLAKTEHKENYYLFYSNKTREDIAYKEILQKVDDENSNFKLVNTLTREKDEWIGEVGRIDVQMLKKYVQEPLDECKYFMCGSKPFVESLTDQLKNEGVGKERIKFEKW